MSLLILFGGAGDSAAIIIGYLSNAAIVQRGNISSAVDFESVYAAVENENTYVVA